MRHFGPTACSLASLTLLLTPSSNKEGGSIKLWYGLLVGSKRQGSRKLSVAKRKETSHCYRYCFQGGLILVAKTRNKEGGNIELSLGLLVGSERQGSRKLFSCQKERNFPLLQVLFPGRTHLGCQNTKQRRRQHQNQKAGCLQSGPSICQKRPGQLPN